LEKINTGISHIINDYRKIAVVGISDKPYRDSHNIALFMKKHGYDISPVNPNYQQVLGLPCYPSLLDVPEKVELVNIFRKPEAVMSVVEEAIRIGALAVWMQLGVINKEAAQKALDVGLEVVMDRCWKIEYLKHIRV
jgi:predicted CoA-binding protein